MELKNHLKIQNNKLICHKYHLLEDGRTREIQR